MALTGTYTRNLDEKNRLAVPKRLREEFSADQLESLYVAPGTDRSLLLYAPKAFERLARRISRQSPNRARNYMRLFYSRAEKTELDSQGRIRIPERLIEFAQLDREVVLLGIEDHAEIWNAQVWEEFLGEHGAAFDEIAAQAFDQEEQPKRP